VFLTATHLKSHKGYELVAKADELANWQSRFAALGFSEKTELPA
jgi:aminomethyltransferase